MQRPQRAPALRNPLAPLPFSSLSRYLPLELHEGAPDKHQQKTHSVGAGTPT